MKTDTMKRRLQERGVVLVDPAAVCVAPDVDPGRIDAGVVLYPGCRLEGRDLAVGPNCRLGAEGPLRLNECQLGAGVVLGGGSFERATLLDGVTGSNQALVRPGCLFEERATFGHCCGFKQTLLMPFATTGSLVNFCDCLLAGGTGSDNHSEVGSSFIHFNFTPHGDKATASLFGCVPDGVLLRSRRIFLGGQCGAVGPVRVAYGTVLAAGQVLRHDVETPGLLVVPSPPTPGERVYDVVCRHPDRVVRNNLIYIGNLLALDQWYRHVRAGFMASTPWGARCHAGAMQRLDEALRERVERLNAFVRIIGSDAERACFPGGWELVRERVAQTLEARAGSERPEALAPKIAALDGATWIETIQRIDVDAAAAVRTWLKSVVSAIVDGSSKLGMGRMA